MTRRPSQPTRTGAVTRLRAWIAGHDPQELTRLRAEAARTCAEETDRPLPAGLTPAGSTTNGGERMSRIESITSDTKAQHWRHDRETRLQNGAITLTSECSCGRWSITYPHGSEAGTYRQAVQDHRSHITQSNRPGGHGDRDGVQD